MLFAISEFFILVKPATTATYHMRAHALLPTSIGPWERFSSVLILWNEDKHSICIIALMKIESMYMQSAWTKSAEKKCFVISCHYNYHHYQHHQDKVNIFLCPIFYFIYLYWLVWDHRPLWFTAKVKLLFYF